MKRVIIFFLSIFILSSLSLPIPERDAPPNEKISGWLTFKETDYEPNKINLNPVLHISVYDGNTQTYFKTKQPLYLSDGKNKIPLIYQEIFDVTPTCTQILAKPKMLLKKDQVYTLEFQTKLGLPELKWKTMDFDCYDYTRPFFKKDTKYKDTILSDYRENRIYVSESDESNCGGILELYFTSRSYLGSYITEKPIKILLSSDFEIPQIIVNQLTFDDTNSVCNYKLTLIDESGNLSLKSKTGKIQLQKLFEEHIHESQGNCCRIPEGYESSESKSFIKDIIMLKNPLFSLIIIVFIVSLMVFLIRFFKLKVAKNNNKIDNTQGENDNKELM